MIRLCDGMIMYRACCACVVRHAHHALASFGCAPDTGTRCDRRVIRGTSEYASQPRVGHGVYVLERCAIASCCVTKRCAIGRWLGVYSVLWPLGGWWMAAVASWCRHALLENTRAVRVHLIAAATWAVCRVSEQGWGWDRVNRVAKAR